MAFGCRTHCLPNVNPTRALGKLVVREIRCAACENGFDQVGSRCRAVVCIPVFLNNQRDRTSRDRSCHACSPEYGVCARSIPISGKCRLVSETESAHVDYIWFRFADGGWSAGTPRDNFVIASLHLLRYAEGGLSSVCITG